MFEEIKRFWNPATGYDLRGVSYERLRQTPLQWPCPPESTSDRNPIRYLNDGVSQTQLVREDGSVPRLAFPTTHGRAVFFARPHLPPEEMPDDDYPFLLNTGRLPHQWHTMTKTGKVAKLNKLNPGPFVEIHPDDAARLQISDERPGRNRFSPRPCRAARGRHRPGAAGQLLRALPLERRVRRVPLDQRRHQRRRRPDITPTRIQGVRRHPDEGRCRHSRIRAQIRSIRWPTHQISVPP